MLLLSPSLTPSLLSLPPSLPPYLPPGGGKTTLAQVLVSGQSAKSASSSPSTKQAIEHCIRVPILYEGKPVSVSLLITDLPGADASLLAALGKNPKIYLEADLALLCVPPTDKQSYVAAAKALDFFKGTSSLPALRASFPPFLPLSQNRKTHPFSFLFFPGHPREKLPW